MFHCVGAYTGGKRVHEANRSMEKDCPVNEVCSGATEGPRRYQIYDAASPRFPRSSETMREWLAQIAPELPTSRLLGAVWYHLLSQLQIVLLRRTAIRPPTWHWRHLSDSLHLQTSKQTNGKHNFAAKEEHNIFITFTEIISQMHVPLLKHFVVVWSWPFVLHTWL